MKKMSFLTGLLIISIASFSQTEKNGYLLLKDGNKVEGSLAEQFKKNSSIQLTNASGKQSEYNAANVKTAVIGSTEYSSFNNEFYETVSATDKYLLLKKETKSASSISYNGTEPIVTPSTQGSVNDLFLFIKADNDLILLSKKNFRKKFQSLFPACTTLAAQAENTAFSKEALAVLLKAYAECK